MKSFKSAQLFGAQMRVSGRGNCELSQTVTDSSSSKRGKAALSILQMALFCSEIWVHKQLASNSKTSGPNRLHCPRASCRTSESSWHKETVSWRTAQGTVGVRNRSEVEHGRTSSKGIKLMLIIYIYILCIYIFIYPLYNIQAYHHIWKVRVAGVAAETQRRSCGTGAGCPGRVGTGACGGSELADLQIRGMPSGGATCSDRLWFQWMVCLTLLQTLI